MLKWFRQTKKLKNTNQVGRSFYLNINTETFENNLTLVFAKC